MTILKKQRATIYKFCKKLGLKGAQSPYFELFWPHTKLPLNGSKPKNNSFIR